MKPKRILLTGSSGFVGKALADALVEADFEVLLPTRNSQFPKSFGAQFFQIGSIDSQTAWNSKLDGVDTVIHCAAISSFSESGGDLEISRLREHNVAGTLRLAQEAANLGVRRFIFISTIKVNGEVTKAGRPFKFDDLPSPVGAYALSKYEAEQGLNKISKDYKIDLVIIRSPIVYGPGVGGNFGSLIRLVNTGLPLPLSNIRNKRSYISIDNLVNLVLLCIIHPSAKNQLFLASDGHDFSICELVTRIAEGMGKTAKLFSVPTPFLRVLAKSIGREQMINRLIGSLQVDISHTQEVLSWMPPITIDEGLQRCLNLAAK
jgi:nucleoside-diphosphate-sugar epimerase